MRFFIFMTVALILFAEIIMIQYMAKTDVEFGSKLIAAEFNNFEILVGTEHSEIVYKIGSRIKFVINQFVPNENLFNQIINIVFAPILIGLIRILTTMLAMPFLFLGAILGTVEGYVEHNKKIEFFIIKSSLIFHFVLRTSLFFFFAIFLTYLFSPYPINPYIIIYSFGIVAFILTEKLVANFPFGKI